MKATDKCNKFERGVFSCQKSKDGKVFIYWYTRQVMVLKNRKAQKFIERTDGLDDRETQLVMAKMTGNFKRGNERKG